MLPALAHEMSRQLGVFTRQQALAAGHDEREVRQSLQSGEWVPVRRGIYATREQLQLVAADRAARHRLLVAAGLPTTSAARTILDVARRWSFRDAVVTADHALRLELTDSDELRELLLRRPSWPRGSRALQVVQFADARSESPGEWVARVVFAEEGLPVPTLQLEVFDARLLVGRLDFAWEEQRVAGEFDGRVKYGDRDVLLKEKRREDWLRALGWRFVRFGWEELFRPRTLARRIRAALAEAAA